ncbi:lysozyme inhibitor LprI family protein [Ralstonia mojiangensis]|uniref:lysozyme inhibitor LprI family protein n=1 Tax=Ralstonia mojiangensis TaxID=2953895 RepID=UPI0020908006|nr:lysozyme inhibitor LprI family protein [Ralstonia mojiangensis]MCO5411118.1 lysozyme inhibitor LprI family protein [Ralstonia mojiangensis]
MQNNQNQPIWNPSTVTGLSFIFTPAFGSYLQASNWTALGQAGRASTSKAWFYFSLLFLAAVAVGVCFADKAGGDGDAGRGVMNVAGLVYFFIWYVLSGRKQASYVKDAFGKTYAKKSMVKPVLAAIGAAVLYTAAVFGLLLATQGTSDAADKPSGGPLSNLTALLGRTGKLDCAAKDVKGVITETYAEQLAETGSPDLVMAIAKERIKFRVEMITEVARNNQSKNVACSGKLVVEFPKEDLVKAAQVKESKVVEAAIRGFRIPTDPVFSTTLSYLVSTPADKAEKQNGPIVKMTTRAGVNAGESDLGPYMVAYTMLAYAAPDITASSKNTKPWDKEWKTLALQGCTEHQSSELCACKMAQFEKLVTQEDMQRIGYTIQSNALVAAKYTNFIALSEALNKQCPLPQGIASVLAPSGQAVPAPAPVEEPAKLVVQAAPVPTPAAPATRPVLAAITASFDCSKASSKIEKLICSTPETGDADRRLAAAYASAKSKSFDANALRSDQLAWMKQQRNACNDTACLLKTTEARIQALSAM